MDPSTLPTGKKLGVVRDRRTIQVGDIARIDPYAPAPSAWEIAHNTHEVPMFANDRYGDCTFAGQGHRIVCQERSSSQARNITLTDDQVLLAYSMLTGFREEDPSSDNGAYELDVLNFMRKIGLGSDPDKGGAPHTIGAFAEVETKNHAEVKHSMRMFGGLYIGAGLPISAQSQMGDVWKVVSGPSSVWGSWGGHAMYARGYDSDHVKVFTWGQEQLMSWQWWDTYVDEVYAIISDDYLRRGGHTPQGLDVDQLNKLLAAL